MDQSDADRTLYVGNLSEEVTEEILYELFFQVGPLANIRYMKEKDGRPRTYAFVVFEHECSVPYAIQVMDGTILFGKRLNLKFQDQSTQSRSSGSPMYRNGSSMSDYPSATYDRSKVDRLRGHYVPSGNSQPIRYQHSSSPPSRPYQSRHNRGRDSRNDRSDSYDRNRSDRKNDFDRQRSNRRR